MLKFGVCEFSQDTPAGRLWRRGPLAATLLASANAGQFDRVMPHVSLSNGTMRTTSPGRFDAFHKQLNPILQSIFPATTSRLRVEDWAVSSGIVAREWYESLREVYRDALYFSASDWMLYLIEAHLPETGGTYVLEADGTPIQYVKPPFVVQLIYPVHPLFFYNRMLRAQALDAWKSEYSSRFHLPETLDEDRVLDVPPFRVRSLPLIRPDVMALRSPNFEIRRHSVFEPASRPVDIIRTMNILNFAYFKKEMLETAAKAVYDSLVPEGVWIVGRTVREGTPAVLPEHHVSILRKAEGGKWKVVRRIGAPSEMESLLTLSD